jgi:hypothetical protein
VVETGLFWLSTVTVAQQGQLPNRVSSTVRKPFKSFVWMDAIAGKNLLDRNNRVLSRPMKGNNS